MEQLCPVCRSEMFKNLEGKAKNPKAPDWKCSNTQCKFQWDKATKTYIPSEFRTSIWDNKLASPYPNSPKPEYPYYNTPNAVPGAKQSDKTAFETEVVSLLKEIRDLLKNDGPPQVLKEVVYPTTEEDLREFGA